MFVGSQEQMIGVMRTWFLTLLSGMTLFVPMDTTEWMPHCFGRFLIDLPPGAQVRSGYRIWGEPIEPIPEQGEALVGRIKAREGELHGAQHKSERTLFFQRNDYEAGAASLLYWAHPSSTAALRADTFLVAQGQSFLYRGLVAPDRIDSAVGFYESLNSRIRARTATEIPAEPGFCVEGGYIAGNEFMAESFRAGITLPGHPGMHMTFRSATGAEDSGLLERAGGFFRTEVLGTVGGMKTLRKGQRAVGPIPGEEYLVAGGDRQQRVYGFRWEFPGRDDSQTEPNLSLEMGVLESDPDDAGKPPRPAFESDGEALQLWDTILQSIRLRPGAV